MNGHAGDVFAIDQNLAAIVAHQTDNHVEGCGFASAIGAKQTNHLAFFNFDGDVKHHLAAAVRFLQMPRF